MEYIEKELAKEHEKNLCANEKCTNGEEGKRKKLGYKHGDHSSRAQPVLFALLRVAIQPGMKEPGRWWRAFTICDCKCVARIKAGPPVAA